MTAGLRWRKVYRIQSERPRTFELSSTLAIRYAAGAGDIRGLRVSALRPDSEQVTSATSRIVVHELMLHVGSGFYF